MGVGAEEGVQNWPGVLDKSQSNQSCIMRPYLKTTTIEQTKESKQTKCKPSPSQPNGLSPTNDISRSQTTLTIKASADKLIF